MLINFLSLNEKIAKDLIKQITLLSNNSKIIKHKTIYLYEQKILWSLIWDIKKITNKLKKD